MSAPGASFGCSCEQLLAVGGGLAAGAVVSAGAVQFVKQHLYEITVYDTRIWIIAIATMALVALVGVMVPARRASGTDPVRALRVE